MKRLPTSAGVPCLAFTAEDGWKLDFVDVRLLLEVEREQLGEDQVNGPQQLMIFG